MILLHPARDPYETRATPAGDDLWLPLAELTPAAGWELKPEGLCRGAVCVPVCDRGFVRDTRFNLTALARTLGQPIVRDAAPDFRLPDLEGRMHPLSEHRGRKVFLASTCLCGRRCTRRPARTSPWIRAAKPTYPCLIDEAHVTAELYGMVNVPAGVRIDETGHIVRPARRSR